jgi:colanic acid/amylovoran biosynthesis protein
VVRETLSKNYLEELGIVDNVVLLPDPAFSLGIEQVALAQAIEAMLRRCAIGLNLSPLLARYRPNPERWEEEGASWVSALLNHFDSPILLVPHVMQSGNDDQEFLMRIKRLVRPSDERLRLLSAYELSSRQLKYVISRLRLFIGARTHATIAALSTNVPTLSIGYSVKANGINRDLFGHEEWVISHLGLSTSQLVEKVTQLFAEEEEVKKQLADCNETYRMLPSQMAGIL